jgi:hypothetical protein
MKWRGVYVYAGTMQAKAYKAILLPSMKALSDYRLYPETAFHKFININ